MIEAHKFNYPELHWWLHFLPSLTVRCQQPRYKVPDTPKEDQLLWNNFVKSGDDEVPFAVLEPLLVDTPQDCAIDMVHHQTGFPLAFDVWWFGKKDPSKGYLPLHSAGWFYQHLLLHLPPHTRTFNQIILPHRTCMFYFDLDTKNTKLDIEYFLQAVFEEMEAEIEGKLTVQALWESTLLLDASCNWAGEFCKMSCHGISHKLKFRDNHTDMKQFATRIYKRLESRHDSREKLQVFDKKKNKWIIPLDLSVYSHNRVFRLYGNIKMNPNPNQQRPLVLATYNRYSNTPTTDFEIFLLSIVPQPELNEGIVEITPTPKQTTVQKSQVVQPSSMLEDYLLKHLVAWGNTGPSVSAIQPARGEKWAPGTLYVSFANATHAYNHQHNSNNVFAIVEPRTLRIYWHCHHTPKCPIYRMPLSVSMARFLAFGN